ncbi:dihydroorotate dehydrogenase [Planomicrobium sp. Y74]|uniref:dihydroorotate dehydrogenase n=1 Tax=Planomicrobium sp. Y74 TaxID=2478977 RepID=UPI000EF43F72|nr:dihydroorotate dehydrogenase [Planomicrobium sp. Y74]RLQ91029.1 dihydroorotate dehydrogenase [Planomicrobium sp. Y74]
MPDWTYHTVFKPGLSHFTAKAGREFIHQGMTLISTVPGGSKLIEYLGHTNPSAQLETELFGFKISNPIGLSGKIDPELTGTKAFGHLGFGFIEVGPVTSTPEVDRVPIYTHARDNLVFPYSPESPGIEKTVTKLRELKEFQKPVFIRVGNTKSFNETLTLSQVLADYGDAFIVRGHYSDDEWQSLKGSLKDKPLLVACSLDELDNYAIGKLTANKWLDGVIVDEEAKDTGVGLECPLSQANSLMGKAAEIRSRSKIPIIVSGGITEPKDALALFGAGVDLVMLTAGYVFTGPGLPKRINEALLDTKTAVKDTYNGWIWHWLFGFLMLIGGIAALIVNMTIVVLPYDAAFLKMTREELIAINPNIYRFMQHDRMTVAGTMISGGIIYMQLARHGVRYGLQWAKRAIHIAGILGFLGILLFLGFGYFDWLHGILWLILLPFFWKGYLMTKNHTEHASSSNRTNHRAWKKSLWGQLAFVALGTALAAGGLVISTIGVNGVFVQTDIAYICMSPEQLAGINDRLIPVIAHDRAGLGSALISVGLLVLMLALWGFQQGQKWVWYTFMLGGIPAFSAAIIIHYVIGYTTFIHIFPAYIALLLFAAGLWYSKKFFFKKQY